MADVKETAKKKGRGFPMKKGKAFTDTALSDYGLSVRLYSLSFL